MEAESTFKPFYERSFPLPALLETEFSDLVLHARGKVRDLYSVGEFLLLVATDRISAFDHVLATGIPGKGKVLTQISLFWFDFLRDIVPNHLVTANVDEYPRELAGCKDELRGRSMLVKRAQMFPVECVVRGYLSGSGWKDYRQPELFAAFVCLRVSGSQTNCPNRSLLLQLRASTENTMKIFRSMKWSLSSARAPRKSSAISALPFIAKRQSTQKAVDSSLPTPSLNLARLPKASFSPTRCLRRIPHVFGRAKVTSLVAPSLPSTSSMCVIISKVFAGTSRPLRPACQTM